MLIARATDRPLLLGAAAVATVWTKETAYGAVLLFLLIDLVAGLRDGSVSLWPLRMGKRLTALSWAAVLAPLPLVYAMAHDLALPGAPNHGSAVPLLDMVLLTPWLLPFIAIGLRVPRIRPLAITSLVSAGFLVALQLAARDVPQWYEVPTTFFAVVAAIAGAHAAWQARWPWSTLRWAPMMVVAALLVVAVVVPAGAGREILRPLTHDAGDSLSGTWNYELNIRDRDLRDVRAQIPLAQHPDVLAIDLASPGLFVPIVEEAHHVYADSSFIRTLVPFEVEGLAERIEANGTWTLLDVTDLPMNQAIVQVYADCLVYQNPTYDLYVGAPCAGRAARLEAAWRAIDPET
jgi:hypothetical protein